MKGIVQSFVAGLNRGTILGDDQNKYIFFSSNWKDKKKPPRTGLRVVFEIEGEKAVEINLAKSYVKICSSLIGYPVLFFVLYHYLVPQRLCGCRRRPMSAGLVASVINRAQQAYYLEHERFSDSLESLGLSFDSKYYNVAFSKSDNQKNIFIITVTKKYFEDYFYFDESYQNLMTGNTVKYVAGAAASVSESDSGFKYIDIICQSIEPSKEIKAPIYKDFAFKCAADSEEIN